MKNVSLVLICLFSLFSCKNKTSEVIPVEIIEKKKEFLGFDGLLIGSVFEDSEFFKYFITNNKPNDQIKIYSVDKLKISNDIGVVESVDVYTYDGKIKDVKFHTGKYSYLARIQDKIDSVAELYFTQRNYDKEYYLTLDKRIEITKQRIQIGLSGYAYQFEFLDEKLKKEIELKADSLEKANYFKDMKQFQN